VSDSSKSARPIRLSVVVPCFNNRDTLPELLQAFARETWEHLWELIVADNGSADGSPDVAAEFGDRIDNLRVIDASGTRGSSYARNAGIDTARGDLVCFCDADDVIAPGWIAAVGDALLRHDLIACRQDAFELNPVWLAAARGSTQSEGLSTLWYPPYLPHAGGCGMGARREHLLAVGGFDVSMPTCQDTDLAIKLQQLGLPLIFVPDAVIHIRFRDSMKGVMKQSRNWAMYNQAVFSRYRAPGDRLHGAWHAWFRNWSRLFRLARRGRTIGERYRLLWQLGWQIGLLQGSLRFRVPPVADFSGSAHVPPNAAPLPPAPVSSVAE